MQNAVARAVQEHFGDEWLREGLPGPYGHVMYMLEGCYGYDCGWAAYAYAESWLTVYQGRYYRDAAVQIHELGHNFGLVSDGGGDRKARWRRLRCLCRFDVRGPATVFEPKKMFTLNLFF